MICAIKKCQDNCPLVVCHVASCDTHSWCHIPAVPVPWTCWVPCAAALSPWISAVPPLSHPGGSYPELTQQNPVTAMDPP